MFPPGNSYWLLIRMRPPGLESGHQTGGRLLLLPGWPRGNPRGNLGEIPKTSRDIKIDRTNRIRQTAQLRRPRWPESYVSAANVNPRVRYERRTAVRHQGWVEDCFLDPEKIPSRSKLCFLVNFQKIIFEFYQKISKLIKFKLAK